MDMPGQSGVVYQNAVVAEYAVVANMHIGHQQVVITDGGFAAILHGAPVNGDPFTDNVVITDHQSRGLAFVFQIGSVLPHGGELVDVVVLADAGGALDHHMGGNHCSRADFDIGPDNGPGAHFHIGCQPGLGMDYGGRINQSSSHCRFQ